MARAFKTICMIAALVVFLLALLFPLLPSLAIRLWHFLIVVAIAIVALVGWRKPRAFIPVTLSSLLLLAAYYLCYESVSVEKVRRDQTVNGIPFGDLAGSYYGGSGYVGSSLHVSADGTFSLSWNSCVRHYRLDGEVSANARAITIHPQKKIGLSGIYGPPMVLIPVKWDRRLYLVLPEEMREFCTETNLGWEPRKEQRGRFYLRQDDWTKAYVGLPSVGQEWHDLLLAEPAPAIITRLINDTTGIVNIGSQEGLRKGAVLMLGEGASSIAVRVTSVRDEESTVESWRRDRIGANEAVVSRLR